MLGGVARSTARASALRLWKRGLSRSHRSDKSPSAHKAGAVVSAGEGSGRPSREVVSWEGEWVPVKDQTTGGTYYWNKRTNETTAVGVPRPQPGESPMQLQPPGTMGVVGQFGTLVLMGAGVSLSFALVRVLLGA
mmetsp:Transcript_32766/g.92960  ORF Transcript_32766/g.92960 Transcript_32766/m.92960 type:complete len:135 (+) Transcript_32766:222-626(+)|eukprot:CAMPEP_0117680150 /NCGR_PEP_ID=MMETSP0804-20121206/18190_1 /TAXON_ID=1074897 /ORGANISM="Tetraselmis astigmatica, Strain CCMP880" /LENGTH=134 /DNA_ID=CAMNT_0005489611 /DNA_START=170 /DNA_END=574 /DNA_ORIENTATION=+